LAAACVLPVVWLLVFNHFRPDYLVDEPGHLGNIYHFLEGRPGWPEAMPMLPGYHFIVAGLWQLHPPFKLLTLARLVPMVCTLMAIGAFVLAWRRLHEAPAGPPVLLLACFPLLQPFTGMAYTDAPALAFVLAAWALHLSGNRALAALALALATCLRQSSLVWAGFIVAGETLGALAATDTGKREPLRARIGWMVSLLLAATAVALAAGRVTVGGGHGNPVGFNPAQLHFAGLLLLLLGLPLWIAVAVGFPGWYRESWRHRPLRTAGASALFLATAFTLGATFTNSHPWNRDLSWEGCSFTLLRNWPLVALERAPWLRHLSGLNLAAIATFLVVSLRRQPYARALMLAAAAGLAPVAISSLVEPRYFIPPLVMALVLTRTEARTTRMLTAWWGALSFLHAPFVAAGLSLW
jgi:hypothetical protein